MPNFKELSRQHSDRLGIRPIPIGRTSPSAADGAELAEASELKKYAQAVG